MTLQLDAKRDSDLEHAISLLRAGELVAVPTETVYGLAADARQPTAVSGIFAAKQRPANHPLIVHLGHIAQLEEWVTQVPDVALAFANHFWPGPLTLVLPKATWVDPIVTGGRDTLALRIPAHPALRELLQRGNLAVAAPSANPHKGLSPTSAAQVMACMQGKLAAVLDGGDCTVGIESTIVDLTSAEPRVLRAGPITAATLADFLGSPVHHPQQHNVAVPGNMQVHYRPRTRLKLKTSAEVQLDPGYRVARLLLSEPQDPVSVGFALTRLMPQDKPAYARLLYRALHEADQLGAKEIWVELPPTSEDWADVHDRLGRAASS